MGSHGNHDQTELGAFTRIAGAFGRHVAIAPDSAQWIAATASRVSFGRGELVVATHDWAGSFDAAAFADAEGVWLLGAWRADVQRGALLRGPVDDPARLALGLTDDERYKAATPIVDRGRWRADQSGLLAAVRLAPLAHGPSAPQGTRLLWLDANAASADRLLAHHMFGFGALLAGRRWLVAGQTGAVDVFTPSGELAVRFDIDAMGVTALALGQDERLLAAGTSDGRIALWDLDRRVELGNFAAHSAAVSALAWHPLGDVLLSSGFDGLLALWAADTTGAPPARLAGTTLDPIADVAIAPDGSWLIAALQGGGELLRSTLRIG